MEVGTVDYGRDLQALLRQVTAPCCLAVVVRRPPGDVMNGTRALKASLACLDQIHNAAWDAIAGFKARALTVAAAFAESHGLGEHAHSAVDPCHGQRRAEDPSNRIFRRYRRFQPARTRIRRGSGHQLDLHPVGIGEFQVSFVEAGQRVARL